MRTAVHFGWVWFGFGCGFGLILFGLHGIATGQLLLLLLTGCCDRTGDLCAQSRPRPDTPSPKKSRYNLLQSINLSSILQVKKIIKSENYKKKGKQKQKRPGRMTEEQEDLMSNDDDDESFSYCPEVVDV